MGVDLLDIKWRIRGQLKVDLDFVPLFQRPDGTLIRTPPDCTAGELMNAVVRTAESQGTPLPDDAWPILQKILADCLHLEVADVKTEALLAKDLGVE